MHSVIGRALFVMLLAVVCLSGAGCVRHAVPAQSLRPAPEAVALMPQAPLHIADDPAAATAVHDSSMALRDVQMDNPQPVQQSAASSATVKLRTGIQPPAPRQAAAEKSPKGIFCTPYSTSPLPTSRNPSMGIWRTLSMALVSLSTFIFIALIEEPEDGLYIAGAYLLACLFGMSITSDGDFTMASFVVILLFQLFVMMTLSLLMPEVFLLPLWLESSAAWLGGISFLLYLVGLFIPIRRRPVPGGRPLEKRAWKKALNKLIGGAVVSLLVALTAGGLGMYMGEELLTILGFSALAFTIVCLVLAAFTALRKD